MGDILAIQHNKQESKLMGITEIIKEKFTDKPQSSIKEARKKIYKLTRIKQTKLLFSKLITFRQMKRASRSVIP